MVFLICYKHYIFQTVPKPAPPKPGGIKLTKNFASPDCTAKVTTLYDAFFIPYSTEHLPETTESV